MLVEITQKGMDYWDNNRAKTEVGKQIGVEASASEKDQGLFVLGILYGAGPDDPTPLIQQDSKWRKVIANLVEAKYLDIVDE